jgi:predicted Zn-dependent protease
VVVLPLPTDEGTTGFAPLICVENAYPPLPAEAGLAGARFLVNLTSEGEVGGPVQEQLLRICILRAVENRLAYVRAGNTGISGFIDPLGRMQSVLVGENGGTIFVHGVLIDTVRLAEGGATPYARSRDAFAKGCVLVTLVLLAATWRRHKSARPVAAVGALLVMMGCGAPQQPGGDPADARRALEEGHRLSDDGRAAAALQAYARACAAPDACRESLRATARCFLDAGQPENGADYFAAVVDRFPELSAEAGLYRGYLLEKALDAGGAEAAYRESIATKPTAEAYELLGHFLMRKNDVAEGVETFRRATRTFPGSSRIRYFLARALLESGELQESRDRLEGIVREDPGNAAGWTSLGRVYLALGQQAAAVEALQRAIEAEEDNLEARFQLARTALRGGNVDEAYRLLNELRRIEESGGSTRDAVE